MGSDSDDGSNGSGQSSGVLTSACLTYNIQGFIDFNCLQPFSLFLPLCDSSLVDGVNAVDLSDLLVSASNNVATAGGGTSDGRIGIFVGLNDYNITDDVYFTLCFKNIIIDEDQVGTNDVDDFGTSQGAFANSLDSSNPDGASNETCRFDGLPCFNFYFANDCDDETSTSSPETTISSPTTTSSTTDDDDADGSIDDDDDEEEEEEDDDEEDAVAAAKAIFGQTEYSEYVYGENENKVEEITVSLSEATLRNVWLMVISFCCLNLMLYFCFRPKSLSSNVDNVSGGKSYRSDKEKADDSGFDDSEDDVQV